MIPGVNMRDFAQIFEDLDLNKDGSISLSEFGMFIEGAKLNKQQRMNQIDPQIIQEMQNEAMSLFMQFDQDRDGNLTAAEL
jgi:Ca2+-binding EF-hand superfamily protein